jgi:DNA invertase Pin-like site-specific DNA recombinase
MIVCYCRVSSKDQKVDSQKAEITRWLRGNKFKLSGVTWYEDVESGATLQRPAFDSMQQAVFNGEIATLVVWKLDRISRDMRDGINLLADWCERRLRVLSVTEQLDLSGTVGRIVASVLFGIAEIQRTQIRERQAAGIALAKERGSYTGRKKGTTKAKPKRARDLCEQGLTQREIAAAMNMSERTVRSYLKQCPKPPKTMRVELYLTVENNSKFVRGKGKSREEIEWDILSRYGMEKPDKDGHRYILTIPYETDEELDRIIYDDILWEASRIADWRNGFVEADVISLDDPERSW